MPPTPNPSSQPAPSAMPRSEDPLHTTPLVPDATFISIASLETGKALGAILIPHLKLHLQCYEVEIKGEDIEPNRYYTKEEMDALDYKAEPTPC